MHFYRLLLALFLLLFTGEFCAAQSWDWVVGSKSYLHGSSFVTENGHSYITHDGDKPVFSSADTLEYYNETLTKIDRSGKRICGISIGYNSNTLWHNSKQVYVRNGVVYLLLTTEQDITIGGKFYPKPATNHRFYKENIYLIKLDTNCVIQESHLLGWKKDAVIFSMKVSPDDKIYLEVQYNDSLYLSSNYYVTGNGSTDTKSILAVLNNKGDFLWNYSDLSSYRGTFDKYGNYWLLNHYHSPLIKKTRYSKFSPDGIIIDSLIIEGKATHLIHIDDEENILLAGFINGDIRFQNGDRLTNQDNVAILIKYDKNKKLQWYKYSYERECGFYGIITDKSGNIYLSGHHNNWGSQNFKFAGLNINVLDESFIIKLDKNGNGLRVQYAKSSGTTVISTKLYRDDCDNIYLSGIFYYKNNWTQERGFLIGKHFTPVTTQESGAYLAKLNPDKLQYDIYFFCKLTTLKNTSDTTAYTSFEWTLPDGTKQFSRDAYIETHKYTDTVLISLKGIKPNGCENIFTRKFNFDPMPLTFAKFTTDSFVGCQWVGIRFHNLSTKRGEIRCADCHGFVWDFGDGTTSNSWDSTVEHIYKKPGKYKISLQYWIIPCSDTFTLEKQITIIEAPKPGFTVNQTVGCAPLTVNITNQSIGEVETYFYTSGDGQTSNQSAPTFIYTKPGKYFITQNLKGPTDCITKDSVQIIIRAGYSQSTEPEILTATVTDSNYVKVSWKKNDVTANYKLIRQSVFNTQTFQFQSGDSFYIDKDVDVNKAFYSYTLYGTDSCENTKQATRKAQTILLENHSQTTEYNYLRWSPYKDWKNGVQEYKLQYKTDSDFADLNTFPGHINDYKDAQLYPAGTKQICYKIIATENAGNMQQSQSNTLCMPFLPTIIVPNAFSPNNDSINDVFTFSAIGVETYQLTIYNRWGEKIYSGTEKNKGWDGKFKNALSPEGEYLYKISAKPYIGKTIFQSGNLILLR